LKNSEKNLINNKINKNYKKMCNKSKLPLCVIGKIIDDEFNRQTSDRSQLINSYVYIPIELLATDADNIIKDALFKIKTSDIGLKKQFVIHCVIYDEKPDRKQPKIFLVIFL
jgi:phosphoribosylformylglycinamidine (FGAM) synthase-like enzyme